MMKRGTFSSLSCHELGYVGGNLRRLTSKATFDCYVQYIAYCIVYTHSQVVFIGGIRVSSFRTISRICLELGWRYLCECVYLG